jgi:hypothetical protein
MSKKQGSLKRRSDREEVHKHLEELKMEAVPCSAP